MSYASSTPESHVRDHSRLAGTYLIILGVLSLLSLYPTGVHINLGGILFIWFGVKVRERHDAFRKASLWFLGLCLAAVIFILFWSLILGTDHMTINVFSDRFEKPAIWLVFTIGIPALIAFGLPFYWLRQDRYQTATHTHSH